MIEKNCLNSIFSILSPPNHDFRLKGESGDWYRWKMLVKRIALILNIDGEVDGFDPETNDSFKLAIESYIRRMQNLKFCKNIITLEKMKDKWIKANKVILIESDKNGI